MNIKETLSKMTLEEKCALLSGKGTFTTRDFSKYGIPQMFLSDGPNGLRKQAGAADHLGLNPSVPATCFPTAATTAQSWNPALSEKLGEALGNEAAANQVNVVLGPGLNIKRSPLCGRNFEYFSEDPYLAGKMAAGYVRGIQRQGVGACPKHFAVNSQETRRMASDSIVDERTLREIYLTGFEIAVKESDPMTIMTSYNLVNGTYVNENEHLVSDILRKEWGFDGLVVTDWGGSNDHALGVKVGSSLEMPAPGGDAVRELLRAVKDGKITEQDVDARCTEFLELLNTTDPAMHNPTENWDIAGHHAIAAQAARECVVLLKNQDDILPLKAGTKIAVIGDFAKKPRYQGAGSSMVNCTKVDNVYDSLVASPLEIIGHEEGFERLGKPDEGMKQRAATLASRAEVAVVCLGLDEVQESEGKDRQHLRLAQNQVDTLKAVSAANPNVVVLLFCGSSIETAAWLGDCKGLLHAGLGGQAGAAAIVEALTGVINPSGKLTETWPVRLEDNSSHGNFAGSARTVEYREGLYVGYRYYQTAGVPVSFPFGYGLSYTTFEYSNLVVTEEEAFFIVKNTGTREGVEIAQLYVAKPDARVFRPAQELKGFVRVSLKAGESKRVSIALDDKAFRYWNVKTNRWEREGGRYEVRIGANCEDIRLTGVVQLKGTDAPNPYEGKTMDCYQTGKVSNVPDEQFAALLGHSIPDGKSRINRGMTFGEMNHGRSPIAWLVWAILTLLLNNSLKKGKPDLNLLFIYNMPLRALAKMAGGMVSMGMVDGIVMELQGFWLIGIIKVLVEFVKNLIQNASLNKRLSQ